jgi:hypothetical protein
MRNHKYGSFTPFLVWRRIPGNLAANSWNIAAGKVLTNTGEIYRKRDHSMRTKFTAILTALALAGATALTATPADAQHWHHGHHGYRHHGGDGGAAIAGFAAGALLGGALAAQQPYYYRGGYGGDAEQYCLSRFRSYDPASGTYLGYDGYRHPCP